MNFKIPIINTLIQSQNQNIAAKESPIEDSLTKTFSEDLRLNHEELIKDFEYISRDLMKMGYSAKLIINSFLAFKYKNIEEAIELIDKTEFSLWNHKFIESDNHICYVCGDSELNHKSVDKFLRRKSAENRSVSVDYGNTFKKGSSIIPIKQELDTFENKENLNNIKAVKNSIKEILIPLIDKEDNNCPICFFQIEEDKEFNLSCNHKFCKDCIVEFLNEEIRNSRVSNIKCPQKGCSVVFDDQTVSSLINEEFLYKYKKFLLREKYKTNPSYVVCPIINCEGYADKTLDVNSNEEAKSLDDNIIRESATNHNQISKQNGDNLDYEPNFKQEINVNNK